MKSIVQTWLATCARPLPKESGKPDIDFDAVFHRSLEPWRKARGLEDETWAKSFSLRTLMLNHRVARLRFED